jgi:uncharacterized protein YjbI with pentapeptide repeats
LIENDRQCDAALHAYTDNLSSLIIDSKLSTPKSPDIVNIARAQTLLILRGLDPIRKGLVILFLKELGLLSKEESIVDLSNADASGAVFHRTREHSGKHRKGKITIVSGYNLSNADLSNVNFTEADLRDAILSSSIFVDSIFLEADLRDADLKSANLYGALMIGADLRGADLTNTNLSETILHAAKLNKANLSGADLRGAKLNSSGRGNQLLQAASLRGVNLTGVKFSKDTEWPKEYDPIKNGAILSEKVKREK